MNTRRREYAGALVLFTIIAAIVAAPAVSGRRALGPESLLDWDPLYRVGKGAPLPISSDYSPINQHYPRDLAFARGLAAGRFDQWNPMVSAGAPLWAEQGGPFFPLKLPFYASPSPATYDVYLALRLVLAGMGAYVLARWRGIPPAAAVGAGASYELCGGSIASLPFGAGSPLYVLPWVVLGALAIGRAPARRSVAGAALALGVTANGGHPTLILMLYTAFAVAIATHAASSLRSPRRALAIAAAGAAAAILGLLLAAPALLPLAELAQFGDTYKNRLAGTLLWRWQLIESRMTLPIALFAPGTFHALHPKFMTLFAFAPAIGMLALALALAGILRGAIDRTLAAVALVGIALALSPPGTAWLHTLPGLRLILPTYPWPLITLALTQAAAHGAAGLAERSGRRAAALGFALAVLGGSSLLLVADAPNGPKLFATHLAEALRGGAGALRLGLPVLFAALALALGAALARSGRARGAALSLAGLMALELGVELVPLVWNPPARALTEPSPAVRFLQARLAGGEWRMVGLPYSVGQPMTPMLFGIPDLRGSSPLPLARYQRYLQTMGRKAAQFVNQDVPVAVSALLDRAAVRWVVFARAGLEEKPRDFEAVLVYPPAQPPRDDPRMPPLYGDEQVVAYENLRALPRVRIVHRFVEAEDPADAARWLETQARAGDGADLDAVVVEPDASGLYPPGLAMPRADSAESARIVDASDPDRLVIEARLESPGLVVVADAFYPGWEARIDGAPAPIHAADLLFRAVRVGAGEHTIDLRYRPSATRYGALLFTAAALIVAALARRAAPARPPEG